MLVLKVLKETLLGDKECSERMIKIIHKTTFYLQYILIDRTGRVDELEQFCLEEDTNYDIWV